MTQDALTQLLGFDYLPLNDDGSVAYIDTPFTFEDGDPLPIYFEKISPSEVVFFDDGEIIWHFIGRGLRGPNPRLNTDFLEKIAANYNAVLTEDGVLELRGEAAKSSELFASYLCTLFDIVRWEKDYVSQPAALIAAAQAVTM